MRNWTKAGMIPVMAGIAVVMSGCDLEVLNPGAIQDADLTTPELMPVLVNGVSAEYNDIGDAFAFSGGRLSDDIAGTGSYFSTGAYRQGIFDWEDAEGFWEQAHEAAWSAGEAWTRLQQVLEAGANTSPDAAKLFALMGHAHRMLGENFCDLVYDVGPAQPRAVAFDSAIAAFQQAITIGDAAGSDGDHWVLSAYAGIAQARLGQASLGTGTWDAARSAANAFFTNGGTTGYVDEAIYHPQANTNQVWNESWGRAEVGVWGTMAQRLGAGADGDPLTEDDNDPRTPYTICGAWNDTNFPPDPDLGVTPTGDCSGQGSGAHQGADGLTAHYRQDKYDNRGSDIPRATGVEMHLILAEAELMDGSPDFDAFIGHINDVRDFYGLDDRAAPTALGTLDFPYENPAVDAMSILDEERYATLWLTGRRLFDLDRWSHPFINGGFIIGDAAQNPRDSCMPVPKNECELNPALAGNTAVCTG